jgi:hypothetical protein
MAKNNFVSLLVYFFFKKVPYDKSLSIEIKFGDNYDKKYIDLISFPYSIRVLLITHIFKSNHEAKAHAPFV